MISQTTLLIALGLATVILATLLVIRIRSEKRQITALQGMSVAEFSEFLRANSIEGKILMVAGKVSEVLKGACACERIIFLRKQRGMLELNYYFGINRFNRADFRAKFTPELAGQLRQSFLPQPLQVLKPFVHPLVYTRLREFELDRFFPIFWRDNLYGVYFIKGNSLTSSPAFEMMVAGLAHSLSAAYHVKWHENRYEKLQQQHNVNESVKASWSRPRSGMPIQILKLVRHRNTESIVPRIVETIQKELGAQQMVYLYEPREHADIRIVRLGVTSVIEPPTRDEFEAIMTRFDRPGIKTIESLRQSVPSDWLSSMQEAGLQYLAQFSLSDQQTGLLALEGKHLPMDLGNRLQQFQAPARELFGNAQSFEQLEELSFTDNLTGLANQRYFRRRLAEECNRARRYGRSLALIIFDLDELKQINDTYGHLAGDAVLSQLGPILKTSIRAIDVIARYGGDEFCIIMPEADAPTCRQFMQRIQSTVAEYSFTLPDSDQQLRCTISLGGAVYPQHGDDPDKLIFTSDMALLRAKARGRNQYLLYCPETMVGTPTEH